ncbi:serine/threonine-protein kinase BLUS1-like isoform X2 [Rhododendron vialii]|uniref:serine/threonine-protein kinase BLUS1-like isoform X2 n=1 Tax=Rhododendron vialii TaxID=182163 RepID=UPI00265EBA0A|nr:serine/threonine-protein kinase BLUS1-like isoform X2 [Rhododendron vialii]
MMDKKKYPLGPEHYTLYEEVGQGVSASVHRAVCIPLDEIVAIKILDFERHNADLNMISREAQTMILVDHPNVLKAHCSFVSDHNLWVVMPFMAGGSCLHILKAVYPDGFEEVVIATVLREVLKGLEYLHDHGHIHRDVKAGNILISERGAIKLGDFGVSACLFDLENTQRVRKTFVGTPCWMAPEVMEQLHGYDFKADIWSFGITALELAHGHAPFSKDPPMKVLLRTLQNAPPGLDYERDNKFSKSFKQMIASCLVKDPSKRPCSKKLLKHSFFKKARSNDYIARTLLEGLPDLGDRLKALKIKEEDMVAQKKIPDGQKEEMSQNEYKRGLSDWNFNLEDVKAQASLIQDEDIISEIDQGECSFTSSGIDHEKELQRQLSSVCHSSQISDEDNDAMQSQPSRLLADSTMTNSLTKCENYDDDASIRSSTHEPQVSQNSSACIDDVIESTMAGKRGLDVSRRLGGSSGSIIFPDACLLPSKDESGAHVLPVLEDAPTEILSRVSKTSANSDELDEKAKPVVQLKGRFKVTSENVELEKVAPSSLLQKSHSMQVITQHPTIPLPSPTDATPSNPHSFFPILQSVLETNIHERGRILSLMKQVSACDFTANHAVDGGCTPVNIAPTEKSLLEAAHDREKELLHEITDLQRRLICAQEELQKYKTQNPQV